LSGEKLNMRARNGRRDEGLKSEYMADRKEDRKGNRPVEPFPVKLLKRCVGARFDGAEGQN
jgi:hypothetical protein